MTHDAHAAVPDTRARPTLPATWLADPVCRLTAAQEAFAEALAQSDPEAPVPACAPWRVADLALHLAGVHWWASAMALGVDLEGADARAPREPERLVEIYGWAAAHLRATLVERPFDAPALTLEGPGVAAFWYRRQLHETLVHLADLLLAGGAGAREACADTPPPVWADTVDEVVTVMHPRQVRLGRAAAPTVALDLVATDTPDALDPVATDERSPASGGADEDGAHAATRAWRIGPAARPADVRVEGPAWALALLVWGRLSPVDPALAVTGDARALRAVLGRTLVP